MPRQNKGCNYNTQRERGIIMNENELQKQMLKCMFGYTTKNYGKFKIRPQQLHLIHSTGAYHDFYLT